MKKRLFTGSMCVGLLSVILLLDGSSAFSQVKIKLRPLGKPTGGSDGKSCSSCNGSCAGWCGSCVGCTLNFNSSSGSCLGSNAGSCGDSGIGVKRDFNHSTY